MCPQCGAPWEGVCPECHQFRGQGDSSCTKCGYPFAKKFIEVGKLNPPNLSGSASAIKDKIAYGTMWFKFWVYVRAPLGALLYGLLGFALPDFLLLFWGAAAVLIWVAYGLHYRKASAYEANWLLVMEPVISTALFPFFVGGDDEQVAGIISAVVLLVIWVWPNWVYFKKREAWFTN
jgi:hypothetical protein